MYKVPGQDSTDVSKNEAVIQYVVPPTLYAPSLCGHYMPLHYAPSLCGQCSGDVRKDKGVEKI